MRADLWIPRRSSQSSDVSLLRCVASRRVDDTVHHSSKSVHVISRWHWTVFQFGQTDGTMADVHDLQFVGNCSAAWRRIAKAKTLRLWRRNLPRRHATVAFNKTTGVVVFLKVTVGREGWRLHRTATIKTVPTNYTPLNNRLALTGRKIIVIKRFLYRFYDCDILAANTAHAHAGTPNVKTPELEYDFARTRNGVYYASGGIKRCICLTSVSLMSVAYIGP